MTTIPSCCIIVLFCLIVWCVVIFFFFGSEFPVTQHKMRVCWSYNENKSKSNEIKFFIQNIWHMILTVSRPCSLLTTMDAYTCLVIFILPLSRLCICIGVTYPYPHFLDWGYRTPNFQDTCEEFAVVRGDLCEDQITLKLFSAGDLPRTPSPESSCLVSFPKHRRSLREGLQG